MQVARNAKALNLKFVGAGSFGSYMRELAGGSQFCVFPEALSTRNGSLEDTVLRDESIDAVYVASPDKLHHEHAIACLDAGKHVFVEKPVYNFDEVKKAAIANDRVLYVNFQRRVDPEMQKARVFAQAKGLIRKVVIESRDPVPPHDDYVFVVGNSLTHDFDVLTWMFPGSNSEVVKGEIGPNTKIDTQLTMTIPTQSEKVEVEINYNKVHPTYVQKVFIDGKEFGHEIPEDYTTLYKKEYLEQFNMFHDLIRAREEQQQAGVARQDTNDLLEEYTKSFRLMEEACKYYEGIV